MNINFFANLFRLSGLLGKSGHSFLVATRRRSRDFLVTTVTESFYLAMYFTFLVFIVGLAASLKWRYKDQLVSGFVRNNLPAVGNPSNQITWETFEHIGSKELTPQQRGPLSLLVDSPFVERIDVYNDSLIIKPQTPWEKLKGQRYIGFYMPNPSQSAFNISSSKTDLSHLPLGDEVGPSSILASSARLHVPARGFVELNHTPPLVDHASQGRVSQVPLGLHCKAMHARPPQGVPSDGSVISMQGRSSNPLAPVFKFENPGSLTLTKSFNVGSYPLTTRPTSKSMLEAAASHSHDLSGIAGRKVGVSPIKKWFYQFYGQLDDIPYKLGSTKLLPDNIERAKPVQRNAELLERFPDPLSNALGDSSHQFQVPLDKLQDCDAGTTPANLRVGTSKLSKSSMRREEPIVDSLIGVKSMGPFGQEFQGAGVRSPQNLGGATARKALPSSPVHPEGQGVDFRTSSHATEVAPRRLVGLAMKRQAFTKEALLLLGADGLVNQDWEPLPLLLNELNSTEVATAVEEGVKALDMGWEEVLALLSDSVSGFTGDIGGGPRRSDGIKQAPIRLMSGYSYPDSTRTKLVRDFTHWAARYGFDLRKAATTLLLAEKEILLPASPSLPLAHSAATGGKRRTMMPLPIVEIDYRPISLSGLASLRDVLSGLKIESLESELDDIPMLETTYQGPAVARDKISNDLVGIGREELAAWVAKAIQGYGRNVPSGIFVDPEATLSLRQSNRLGKKEVLRGEPLVHEKVLAALRPRIGVNTGIRRDKTEETDNRIEPMRNGGPMKSNKIGPEQFLTGSGPKLKDPSQVVALERGDEAPLYPLEIVLTKAAPRFEEEQEVLSLEPNEWRNIFKGVVVQAIENKASLDKIEVLLPSIAMVHRGRLEGENRAGFSGLGGTHAKQHPNQVEKSYKHDRHLDPPVKADDLTKVLTFQEYANLAVLIAQSKRFVGECNYWPIALTEGSPCIASNARPSRGGGGYASGYSNEQELMNDQEATRSAKRRTSVRPRLLCHYLPLSQVAIPESSTKQPISAGNYHKRLTSFTARYRPSSSFRLTEQPTAVWPSKQQMFYQLWEPVTANSWMMFYKLCFAFWIQEMGKDFYKRYGKEIILYALNLLVALGFDAQGIIEDLGLEESPIRVITNGKRRFGDIAGIDSILPELGEIVWFLRSSGRGGQVPKGILLVGPPGTGKTFVVQAIAGEAKVPVLVQSASSLTDSGQKQSGSQKLRDLFDRARQLSPCILFMDEIDTLGVSRPHVIGNTMGADELLESIEGGGSPAGAVGQLNDATPELDPYLSFLPSPRASSESMLDGDEDDRPRDEAPVFREGEGDPQDSPGLDPSVIEVIESHNEERRTRQERLALLMQFLMEMDGLRALHGVVVIGATNRPAVLDPAFTRPGRFERILCLQLPGKQKRIEILKLYSKNLGSVNVAGGAWDYLANRTAGWSAAHLAAAMNQSAIRAIIQETAHTIETVEHGISTIARRSFQASSDQSPQAEAAVLNPDMPFLTFQQSSDLGWRRGDRGGALPLLPRSVGRVANARPRRFDERDNHWSANLSVKLSRTSTTGLAGNRRIARWAYYQAGKAVLQTALPLHPPAAFFPLRPQPFVKSSSDLAKLVASTSQQGSLEPHRRVVLETRLIGLYAGKASEMLALSAYARAGERATLPSQSQGTSISQSDLGIEELTFAGVVANVMISSWYLYSKRVGLQRLNLSTIARNTEEIDDPVLLDLFRHLEEDQEHQVERATKHSQRFQQWSSPSWWQTQVMAEAALVEPGYSDWYRIYIPDPEETERNIDWVPPEDHYHAATANQLRNVAKRARTGVTAPTSTNRGIRHRSKAPKGRQGSPSGGSMGSLTAITWNDLYLINRDYIYHGLINSCFQKAFLLLDKRRELVDFLSDHLIRYDLLRQYEIEQICSNFGLDERDTTGGARPSDGTPRGGWAPPKGPCEACEANSSIERPTSPREMASNPRSFENSPRKAQSLHHSSYIVEADWGSTSRRRISRFIDFDFVKPCYLKRVS